MTANDFRNQSIHNTRLVWLIHGHKVPLEQMENFETEELRDIYHVDDRGSIRSKIIEILISRNMTEVDIECLLG